ncbi:MAG TPA: hypothetical protein VN861_03240 [Candidatus Acidoferrales bacterium]|nr:hypothetical protein [Candidatus Acidoferrales bacterium]
MPTSAPGTFDYKFNVSGRVGTTAGSTLPTPEQVMAVLQAACDAGGDGWTVTK